jgi:hypothetical protein
MGAMTKLETSDLVQDFPAPNVPKLCPYFLSSSVQVLAVKKHYRQRTSERCSDEFASRTRNFRLSTCNRCRDRVEEMSLQ